MGEVKVMALAEFHAALKSQGVSSREHAAVKCPVCGTVQSMTLLANAGCPPDKIETQLAFSCVGRWSGAGPATREGKPGHPTRPGCDWTLGGLFRIHRLEVEMEDGKRHPAFEPATAEEAQALERRIALEASIDHRTHGRDSAVDDEETAG